MRRVLVPGTVATIVALKVRDGDNDGAAAVLDSAIKWLYEEIVKRFKSRDALVGLVNTLARINVEKAETYEKQLKPLPELKAVDVDNLEKTSDVNNELFKGSYRGNPAGITNEIAAAYDLMSTDKKNFNVTIWYNSTYKDEFSTGPVKLVRVPRSINLISNAYLKFLKGPGLRILCEFVKEVPKHATRLNTDIASLLGPLFFTWVVLLLFPVILTSLVYEKQERLRIMMKMHGLGDGPYWLISYAYFLTISVLYVASLVIFGSVIGLKYFRLNSYSIQFVFYFIYLNLQMAIRFLVSSNILKVVAYILVYGTGLLGSFLFQTMLENQSFPEEWIFALELYPGFSLYRGLYEFSQYASRGNGMKWQDLSDSGMGEVLCIMSIEWFLALIIAFYIDQVFSSGKHPFFFLNPFKKSSSIPKKCGEFLCQLRGRAKPLPAVKDLIFGSEYEEAARAKLLGDSRMNIVIDKYDTALKGALDELELAKKEFVEKEEVSARQLNESRANLEKLNRMMIRTVARQSPSTVVEGGVPGRGARVDGDNIPFLVLPDTSAEGRDLPPREESRRGDEGNTGEMVEEAAVQVSPVVRESRVRASELSALNDRESDRED
ncbi:hypothetical protein F2Q68_00031396 [Brassica cretica]|uniref:Uncharacterized protein n=1 Tax=Brassica cretica TaxID=69181 RepID=A0A8S9GAR8_BRACR|nr:hypothetical protein F2Q68_00031396 [Brassica cretica]